MTTAGLQSKEHGLETDRKATRLDDPRTQKLLSPK